jgi:hypothetical protein
MAEPPDVPEPRRIRTASERLPPRIQQVLRIGIVAATLIGAAAAIVIAARRGPVRPAESFEAPRIQVATPSGQVTRLAYLRRGRLLLTTFDGGRGQPLLRIPRRRLACPRSQMLAISPDGTAVALIGPEGATLVTDERLVSSYGWQPKPAERCQVTWSADSRMIAFMAGREALVVHRAGGRIAELHHANGLAFRADGRTLLFAGQAPGLNAGIQSLDLATGQIRTLVTARAAADPLPSGPRVAYTVVSAGEPALWLWPGTALPPQLVSARHAGSAWLSDGRSLLAEHASLGRGGFRIVRIGVLGGVTGVARGELIGVSRVGEVALIGLPENGGFQLFAQDLTTGLRQDLGLPTVSGASWTG